MKDRSKPVVLSLPTGLSMEEVYAEYLRRQQELQGIIPDTSVKELLEYVSNIDEYALGTFSPIIKDVWHDIVSDNILSPKLFIQKGEKRGHPNIYKIVNVVEFLMEKNVYLQDKTCGIAQLYYTMSGEKNNQAPHLTGKSSYTLNHEERLRLLDVLRKYN